MLGSTLWVYRVFRTHFIATISFSALRLMRAFHWPILEPRLNQLPVLILLVHSHVALVGHLQLLQDLLLAGLAHTHHRQFFVVGEGHGQGRNTRLLLPDRHPGLCAARAIVEGHTGLFVSSVAIWRRCFPDGCWPEGGVRGGWFIALNEREENVWVGDG